MLLGGTVLKMSGESGDGAGPRQRVHNCSRIVSPQNIHSDSNGGEMQSSSASWASAQD